MDSALAFALDSDGNMFAAFRCQSAVAGDKMQLPSSGTAADVPFVVA